MTDEEKKPYFDQFKTNWEEYRIARKKYEETLPPKRPSGPFLQFTKDIRPLLVEEHPNKTLIEITKMIGEKWRSLDGPSKQKYTDSYKLKLKEWEASYAEHEATDEVEQ